MRRIPRTPFRIVRQTRHFSFSHSVRQTEPSTPEQQPPRLNSTQLAAQKLLDSLSQANSHANLQKHPQTPLPTRGVGPFTRNAETGKRLTREERQEEKAKEYLYEQPDPNVPLPPLLLRPPGLMEPPVQGLGHGIETRTWWQREFEIWFGRYQKPFDVKAQVSRHKSMNSYNTEWSPKADRRSVRKTHGKFFMSPHALFKATKAKYAPNFTGQTISSPSHKFEAISFAAERKATLIAIFSTQMAHRMCKPYLEAVESSFSSNPDVGVIRVQFEENWMKMALIKYYIKNYYLRPLYTPQQQAFPGLIHD